MKKKDERSVAQIVGKYRWKRFSKQGRKLLKDLAKAKRLIDKHFSGLDSDALCDALCEASRALESVLEKLEPS